MKLSIITINRNNADGLRRTLESTFEKQPGFDDWEQIVVDGASTDSSFAVIDKYRDNPHLGWHVSEPDTGIYNAMNKGAAHAKGDYLLFLNSGDELLPAILTRIFPACADADILYGDERVRTANGNDRLWISDVPQITPAFFMIRSLPHQSTFISKKTLDAIGGYDESMQIAGDHKFFFQCACDSTILWKHLDFPVALFDQTGRSSVPESVKIMERELAYVLEPVFGEDTAKRAAFFRYGRAAIIEEYRRCIRQDVASAACSDGRLANILKQVTAGIVRLWKYRLFRLFLRGWLKIARLFGKLS